MSRIVRNRITGELYRHSTLGDQVRGEAQRRGGSWAANPAVYARRAEAWYGSRPCKGDDLRIIFDAVFGVR